MAILARRLGCAGILLAGLLALIASLPASAQSLRCSGSLVRDGDPLIAVREACGEPDFIDPWAAGIGPGVFGFRSMQQWTYNFGPRRLLQILTFRDGRLRSVTTGGYGFVAREPAAGRCEPTEIVDGLAKYRLLALCGPPDQQTGRFIYSTRKNLPGGSIAYRRGVVPVYRERWIYNFGGNRLLREVTLDNARIRSVETLERGFDR